jgi:16S rRNA (uracil1498-N3)-methyltransferase
MSDRPRIHIPAERIDGLTARLARNEAHYLRDVLRLSDGAVVSVFDGKGNEAQAILSSAAGRESALELSESLHTSPTSGGALDVTVIAALIKHKNFDFMVRKAAELGASRIIPVRTERTVKEGGSGADRWRKIAVEASRQSRRADVMQVEETIHLEKALSSALQDLKLIAWEGGTGTGAPCSIPLADALPASRPKNAVVAVGPEGGFTDDETGFALKCGFVAVGLGPRILRSETAPLAVLAVLQYIFGDLGGRQESQD